MAEKQVHQLTFRGVKVAYDANAFKSWAFLRTTSKASEDVVALFKSYDILFMGKADEIAAKLGDDADAMGELYQAVVDAVGAQAKN